MLGSGFARIIATRKGSEQFSHRNTLFVLPKALPIFLIFLSGCLPHTADPRPTFGEIYESYFTSLSKDEGITADEKEVKNEQASLVAAAAETYELALIRLGYTDLGARMTANWFVWDQNANIISVEKNGDHGRYYNELNLEYTLSKDIRWLEKYYLGFLLCALQPSNLRAAFNEKRFFEEWAIQNIYLTDRKLFEAVSQPIMVSDGQSSKRSLNSRRISDDDRLEYNALTLRHELRASLEERLLNGEELFKVKIEAIGLPQCLGARYEEFVNRTPYLKYADVFSTISEREVLQLPQSP
jgi:hypothetical protein